MLRILDLVDCPGCADNRQKTVDLSDSIQTEESYVGFLSASDSLVVVVTPLNGSTKVVPT